REFKASVLGAYERGHRVMSMPRLQRLARFYGVAVDRLLPADGDDVVVELNVARAEAQYSPKTAGPEPEHVVIDVRSLSSLDDDSARVLRRYVSAIQVRRQDFGRRITIRSADLPVIAAASGIEVRALLRLL